MKNMLSLACCIFIALAASDRLTSDKQQTPSYPIGFDTTLFHITVNFPAPAHKLAQKDAGNYLFAADKSVKIAGRSAPVEETYSLLYQQMQTGAKAEDVANQFIDVLRSNPNSQVRELDVATLPTEHSMDQLFRAVEVVDGKRTDYYIFRVIATGDGVLVAVRTIQKSDGQITDLSDPTVWQFVDSVNVGVHQ